MIKCIISLNKDKGNLNDILTIELSGFKFTQMKIPKLDDILFQDLVSEKDIHSKWITSDLIEFEIFNQIFWW